MLTTEVENFPGFEHGIMGPELRTSMRVQAARFVAELVTTKATKVDRAQRPFRIWTGDPTAALPTHRRHELRASKIMQDRAKNNPKIRFAWNSQVTEVFGEQSVEGVQLTDTFTGATSRLASPACSSPSATNPTPTCSAASST